MNLTGVRESLERDHEDILTDTRYAAEGLDRAACPPMRKYLAQLAAGANCHGLSPEGWREWVHADGRDMSDSDIDTLLDSAEDCMHQAGLWPWSDPRATPGRLVGHRAIPGHGNREPSQD